MKNINRIHLLIETILEQKWAIISSCLVIFLGTMSAAYFWLSNFEAVGRVSIKSRQNAPQITAKDLAQEAEIIKSNDVIEKTIGYLKRKGKYPPASNKYNLISKDSRLSDFLKTSINPASREIEIKYYGKERTAAQDVLTALMEQYISYRMTPTNDLKSKIADAHELSALIKTTQGVSPSQEIEKNIALKTNLEQQLYSLSNDEIEKTLDITELEKAEADGWEHISVVATNAGIVELNHSLLELIIERGKILRQYQADSFKVKAIQMQIEYVKNELITQLQAFISSQKKDLDVILKKRDNINKIIKQINEKNLALKRQMILTDKISKDNELSQSQEDFYDKSKADKNQQNYYKEGIKNEGSDNTPLTPFALTPFEITISKKAVTSLYPIYPNKNIVIPIGIAFSLFIGLIVGFIREFFDHTIKNPSDVKRYLGLEMIFSLPVLARTKKSVNINSIAVSFAIIVLISISLIFIYTTTSLYSLSSKSDMDKTENNSLALYSTVNETKKKIPYLPQELITVERFKTIYSYYDPDSGVNSLQIYSFLNKYNADTVMNRLKTLGINVYVKDVKKENGVPLYRVLIAPFCYNNSFKKEKAIVGSINNVRLMMEKSTGEISLISDKSNDINDALSIIERLNLMGWMSKINVFEEKVINPTENRKSHYKVILSKDCK